MIGQYVMYLIDFKIPKFEFLANFEIQNFDFVLCPCVGNIKIDFWLEYLLQPLHIWYDSTFRYAT